MKSVILCSDLDSLQPCIPPLPESVHYLILRETDESRKIRACFNRRGYSSELPRAALFRERSPWFRSAYVSALGHLNVMCGSREWWAMSFTTKNPISTSLCRDTFVFLLVVELVRKLDGVLIVVTESEFLGRQIEAWGRTEGVAVTNSVTHVKTRLGWIARMEPLAILLLLARALWFRVRVGCVHEQLPKGDEGVLLMVTLVHPHSISPLGSFRDTYFGGMSEWLASQGLPVVVAGSVQGLSVSLARTFQASVTTETRIPLETMLAPGEILHVGWKALRTWWRGRTSALTSLTIDGVVLNELVRMAIREAHASGDVFRSLYMHHCIERLGARMKVSRLFYPYENRAWEKMVLLGIRSSSPGTRTVGYQHASITASHTNFMLADKESEATPLPDVVVTMGAVTKDWLIREGGHPASLVKAGCALRQSKASAGMLRNRRGQRVVRVLVALATGLTEYVSMLTFLDEAVDLEEGREIRIRPHPTLSLDKAVRLLPEGRTRFFYTASTGPVAEDLAWADVVLYASSTIGLEAVGMGVPAVYMDLGDILDTDPMGGWTEFKWVARDPKDLVTVLSEIETLSDAQYSFYQQKGQAYVDAYLFSVDAQTLRVFCEA